MCLSNVEPNFHLIYPQAALTEERDKLVAEKEALEKTLAARPAATGEEGDFAKERAELLQKLKVVFTSVFLRHHDAHADLDCHHGGPEVCRRYEERPTPQCTFRKSVCALLIPDLGKTPVSLARIDANSES